MIVLFVLQQEELNAAVTAQSSLQHFFDGTGPGLTNQAASNVSLGPGNSVNLVDMSVNLGNGSVGAMSKRGLEGRSIPLFSTSH